LPHEPDYRTHRGLELPRHGLEVLRVWQPDAGSTSYHELDLAEQQIRIRPRWAKGAGL
jgi:hypothetical protein